MKTVLHTYQFDIREKADAEAYTKLTKELRSTPGRGHQMHCLSDGKFRPPPGEIELEPQHLFDNQWNTNVGRVFDWFEEAIFGPSGRENTWSKRGHYLDITQEMVDIRNNTLKCQYTGQQFAIKDVIGHRLNTTDQALGSPYLKEEELYLVRLLPVSDKRNKIEPLTQEEKEFLMPLYINAQTKCRAEDKIKAAKDNLSRVEREYRETIEKCGRKIANAEVERKAKLWLLDHDVNLDLVIFYDHTQRFAFGWQSPLSKVVADRLREILTEFPGDYDLIEEKSKSVDARAASNQLACDMR